MGNVPCIESTYLKTHIFARHMATKHDKEQLALGVNERVSVNQVLYVISELIGPCVGWPNWVTKIFWMQKLNTRNGLRLCTFVLGNGMPPHLLFQWLQGFVCEHTR